MDEDPGPLVRPYVMTGGRTSPAIGAFDLISIVMAACQPQGHDGGLEPEAAQILRHCHGPHPWRSSPHVWTFRPAP
jgi:hypothetical protein